MPHQEMIGSFAPGMTVHVLDNKASCGRAAAEFVATRMRSAIAVHGGVRVIFATGASQYEFLDALIAQPGIEWQRVTAFHLDEYCALPADHPASFRHYLQERLFRHVAVGVVHLLDGNATDLDAEGVRYGALLAEHPVDIACVGIGENGHLAFNDPPADFTTRQLVHVVQLDYRSRRQQVDEGHFANVADVPVAALSLTVPAIMAAKVISCTVPEARKAEAVRQALVEPVSSLCPASVLRRHPDCKVFLDQHSGKLLR